MPLAALAGGTLILVAFLVALFFVVVFGYYSYRGSGINAHPHDGSGGAGAGEPSDPAHSARMPEAPRDELDGGITTHGTK